MNGEKPSDSDFTQKENLDEWSFTQYAFANAKNPSEVNFSDDRLTEIMITGIATVFCRICLKYSLQFTDIITIFLSTLTGS